MWGWTAVTLAVAVVAALLWRGSDAAAVDRSTTEPARLPPGTLGASLALRWSAPGHPVPDSVVAGDRVFLGSPHGVRALDVGTGREAWHYTRSNATLCGLTATNGVAVAVFRATDRCDEAVAFTAGTGVYAWTRNLDLRPDATLSSAPQLVLATSPTALLALDPVGDNVRWRYQPPDGCRLLSARAGAPGVAVLQGCADPAAAQLRLLDTFTGEVRWSREVAGAGTPAARVVGAGEAVGVATATGVRLLGAADGVPITDVAGGSGGPGGAPAMQTGARGICLVWQAGTLTAVDLAGRNVLWQLPARGLPAVPDTDPTAGGDPTVLVPEESGFVRRNLRTGAEVGRSTVADLPEGGAVVGLGPVAVYRLDDRVLGYR